MNIKNWLLILLVTASLSCRNSTVTTEKSREVFIEQGAFTHLAPYRQNERAMDSLLNSLIDSKKMNCVTAFVAKGGRVLYKKSFGLKDIESKTPATVDDYYVLFSQTKAVTTVAFMTLVEKGLVSIDDPVSKYFPEISDSVVTKVNKDGSYEARLASAPMTFLHLMSHSSGLNAGLVRELRRIKLGKVSTVPATLGTTRNEEIPCGQHTFGGDNKAKYLKDEMLALAQYPLGFDPGTQWDYHISSNMLGYMIERISGQSLRDYVKEVILKPLGMSDTDWFYQPETLARFVKPYHAVNGELNPGSTMFSVGATCENQTYCEGALGLNGPIEDYAKFCQMLLNKGTFNGQRILKPETVKLMTTVNRLPEENSGGKGFKFGLGFELYNDLKKPVPAVSGSSFAWGGMMGTQYIIDPKNDLIVLYYVNMYKQDDSGYPLFLTKAYDMAKVPIDE